MLDQHPVCEDVFLDILYLLPRYCHKISKRKRKKDFLVSLTDYSDLIWCLHNDLWRTSVFPDDTNDLHLFAQVINIWRVWEPWKVTGKDHSSAILVVFVKIEETHSTGIEGIYDYSLNNHVVVVVLISIYPVYNRNITVPVQVKTGLEDIITPEASFCSFCLYLQLKIVVTDWTIR